LVFMPLTMSCVGYNALDMTLAALLGTDEDWDQYPDLPVLRAAGCMVHLVNYVSGRVTGVQHLEELNELPSVLNWEIYETFAPNEDIEPTMDIRSDAGWVQLVSEDSQKLTQDFQRIVEWMPTMFQVQADADEKKTTGQS